MPLLDPTSNELKKDKLYSAAIIGATTSGSSRIWIRTYTEGHWTLVIARTPLHGDLGAAAGKTDCAIHGGYGHRHRRYAIA